MKKNGLYSLINESPPANSRILLVEDSAINRDVAIGIMKNAGYLSITVCINGFEAIKMLEHETFNLILMDIQMPEMDGFKAASIVRDPTSHVLDHQAPIIAITANATREDHQACMQAGMNDYISKPFNPGKLISLLHKYCSVNNNPPAIQTDNTAAIQQSKNTIIDNEAFDYDGIMRRLLNDSELIETILCMFIKDSKMQIDILKKALTEKDLSKIILRAHTLKGASSNVGAEKLRTAASTIEVAARAGNTSTIPDLIVQYEEEFEKFVNQVRLHLPQLPLFN